MLVAFRIFKWRFDTELTLKLQKLINRLVNLIKVISYFFRKYEIIYYIENNILITSKNNR